jgi:uncharacterized protein (TIGR02996 family)
MDRYGTWILDQIKEHSPETEGSPYLAEKLAEAAAGLAGAGGLIFGMVVPAELTERDQLLATALAALERWLPKLEGPQLGFVGALAKRANLPIDVTPYAAKIDAAQQALRAKKRTLSAQSEPRNPALEQAVIDNPEDRDAYAVLSDWLQSKGVPRGELIALQLKAERDPASQVLVDRCRADHADVLLGPLVDHEKMHDGSGDPAFTWRRGYIHAARMSYDENSSKLAIPLADVLELVLQHPSGRLVHELVFGLNGEPTDNDLSDLISVLIEERPIALRSLFLGDFAYPDQTEMSWYSVGDVSELWPALPQLAKLIVQGGSFTLGELALPALEHAEFRTGGLTHESAQAIASAKWPKLRRLDVWYGDDAYGGTATIEDVVALLRRKDLPALTHLGLMNSGFSDDICRALPDTPLGRQIKHLDLSLGTMSDAAATALANSGVRFDKLDVSSNYLSDDGIAALKPIAREVIAGKQNMPGEDRNVSVGE